MRENLNSNPPKGKKDEITQEFQCVSIELCKIIEKPEYKYFRSERFFSKLTCIVREEYYDLLEDDSEESKQQYKEKNSYTKRLLNNFCNEDKL